MARRRIYNVTHRMGSRSCLRIPSSSINFSALSHSTHIASDLTRGTTGTMQMCSDGRFVMADLTAARIFGFPSPAELLEAPQNAIEQAYVDSARRFEFRKALASFGAVERFENQILRPDGSKIWIRESANLVQTAQGEFVYETSVEDITFRRASESSSQQIQKIEILGKLAAAVAHDFNNLLTVIKGYSELIIEQTKSDSVYRPQLEQIHLATVRGAALTRQLLTFSRQDIPHLQNINVNAIIQDLEKMLRFMVGKQIQLSVSLDDRLGCIRADSGQIVQILMNLVANARDAIANNGVISLQTRNYKVTDHDALPLHIEPGRYVTLTVEDTGHGIAAENLARISEPFFTTKETGRGTGLGLATVAGLVDKFGGELFVDSELGVGTAFTVLFPRVDGQASLSTGIHPVGITTTRIEGNVLVAEEDESVRKFICDVLRSRGGGVVDAANAGEALLVAERLKGLDLLIADYSLRYMTGPELAERLRVRHPLMKALYISSPIISGASFTEPALPKPFAGSELCERVTEILSGKTE